MADKFRKTIPVKITFGDGEQPTAQKLTAGFTQVRNGTALLEKAIGDLWNQSGDASSNILPLQIPNLARFIGANTYLNPALVPTESSFKYLESIGTTYLGRNTGYLRLPPKYGTSDLPADFTVTNPSGQFTTAVASEYLVDSTGKYWIEKNTGRFRIYGSLGSTTKIEYTVDPSLNWVSGLETVPGVIPDPGQSTFTGCRLELSGGKYYLRFPPRRPLTLSDRETPDNYPPAAEISDNETSSGGVTPKKYWQYSTQALVGAGDEHYRYRLPKDIVDMNLSEGNEIPQGMLLLWDQNNETIIEDAVFLWPDLTREGFAIEVKTSTTDLSSLVTASEAQANYNSSGLTLITCGAPLARTIWTLANAFYRHNHNNEGTLEALVEHRDLRNLNPPTSSATLVGDDYSGHNSRYPTYLPSWVPSRWAHDEHTSLLSRAGSQGTAGGRNRDINDNAMLGDLTLASSTESGGNFLNTSAESRALFFGSRSATSPSLYSNSGGIEVSLENADLLTTTTGLQENLDATVNISLSTFTHGFGVGSQPDPSYYLFTVLDGDREYRYSTVLSQGLGSDEGVNVQINSWPSWAKVIRIYRDEDTTFATNPRYWEYNSGTMPPLNISDGDYPGQTTATGNTGPADQDTPGGNRLGRWNASNILRSETYALSDVILAGTEDDITNLLFRMRNGSEVKMYMSDVNVFGLEFDNQVRISIQNTTSIMGYTSSAALSAINSSTGYALNVQADTSSPTRAAMRLIPQDTDPGTVQRGDMYMYGGIGATATSRLRIHNGSTWERVVQQVFANAATSATISNTAAETNFNQSYTIPANVLSVGSVVRVRAWGRTIAASVNNLTVRLKIGGTTAVAGGGTGTPGNGQSWALDCGVIVRTVGAPGTAVAGGGITFSSGDIISGASAGTFNVTTTGTVAVQVSAQWSGTNVNDQVVLEGLIVDIT